MGERGEVGERGTAGESVGDRLADSGLVGESVGEKLGGRSRPSMDEVEAMMGCRGGGRMVNGLPLAEESGMGDSGMMRKEEADDGWQTGDSHWPAALTALHRANVTDEAGTLLGQRRGGDDE